MERKEWKEGRGRKKGREGFFSPFDQSDDLKLLILGEEQT